MIRIFMLLLVAVPLCWGQTQSRVTWPVRSITAPGTNKQIIYNDNGRLAEAVGVQYDKTTGSFFVGTALLVPVTLATSSPVTVSAWGVYFNNSAGAMTFNLPVIAAGDVGKQYCFRNYVTRAGAITLDAPANTYISLIGTNGTAGGTLVSSGELGDSMCVLATSTTQYIAYQSGGVWTNQ